MLDNSYSNSLSNAVLHTLIYSDIFDYPLTADEVYRYLTGINASLDEVIRVLKEDGHFTQIGNYFTLSGRQEIVPIRIEREARSRKLLPRAIQYGRVLGSLPFVRMVALTGSLAVMNVSTNADFDYMLVTKPGRLWIARAFTLLFNRFVRPFGYTLCPNLIVSENALKWSTRDLYSARELCQMMPITGMEIYQKLMKANEWLKDFLPNSSQISEVFAKHLRNAVEKARTSEVSLQKIFELPLRGKLGDKFEAWEMNRKIVRFSKQAGFGEETIFNADVCQGNFDHHSKWTREGFEERLNRINLPFEPQLVKEHKESIK